MTMEQVAFPETARIQARWEQLARGFCQASNVASEWSRASEDLLMSRLRGRACRNILDLACGVGDPTLRLAGEFPQARVVGLDFVAEMLGEVRRRALERRLDNVTTVTANVLKLPFQDATFDTVTSRFGVQYYGDDIKRRALAEAARVLRPGGRVVLVDWGVEGHGPLKEFYMEVFRQYPETAHANDASTPFELKTDAELAELVEGAGFGQVEHGYPAVEWVWRGSTAALWDVVVALAPQLTQLMSSLEPRLATEINGRILGGLSRYVVDSRVVMPVRHVVVSGVR